MTERSTPTRAAVEPRLRRTSQGDTLGARSAKGVATQTARIRTNAAQGAQQAAVKNILAKTTDKAAALKTLLVGSSPEDAESLIRQLTGQVSMSLERVLDEEEGG